MGDQQELPDLGATNWRRVNCPACGNAVIWTVATSYATKITCDATIDSRSKKGSTCGFTMRRAEWDYLREKPDRAPQMRKRFGREEKPKRTEDIGSSMIERMIERDTEAKANEQHSPDTPEV